MSALSGAAATGVGTGTAHGVEHVAADLFSSIAGGDPGPLGLAQTSHRTDLAVSALAVRDRPSLLRLARWAADADSPVVRVNAAGVGAKTRSELVEDVPVLLARDADVRRLYVRAVAVRVGASPTALAAELRNARDAGARSCAAHLLVRDNAPHARHALASALRDEPVRENVRAYALLLNGDSPCM
ncbi:hypothetical protein [Actinomadura atramentaria]|uniref:hypothetical protein n=1 Tax=Actinomadura atramentaria TaxID=1990 RepID=UPI00035C7C8A|nr:hypothetical protein [Actinomadura atramentaria]